MCLSTAYYDSKDEDKLLASYIAELRVEGGQVILTDVMGQELAVEGQVSHIDLTGGTVIIRRGEA